MELLPHRTAFVLSVALVGATVSAGCEVTPVSKYVGGWTSTGSEAEVCNTGTNTTPLNGSVSISQGPDAPEDLVTTPVNGCNLVWVVSGTTATLKGTQTCTVGGYLGGSWAATFTSGTLTLGDRSISYSTSGTGVLVVFGGTSYCTFSQSGTFTR